MIARKAAVRSAKVIKLFLINGIMFDEGEGFLENGDKIFLYTDGIIELKNQQGEQFGTDRFYAMLKSLHKEPVTTIIQEVYQALKKFSNNFVDDISLIGFEKR